MFARGLGGTTANNATKSTVQGDLGSEWTTFICERPTLPVGEAQLKGIVFDQLTRELTSDDEVSL